MEEPISSWGLGANSRDRLRMVQGCSKDGPRLGGPRAIDVGGFSLAHPCVSSISEEPAPAMKGQKGQKSTQASINQRHYTIPYSP